MKLFAAGEILNVSHNVTYQNRSTQFIRWTESRMIEIVFHIFIKRYFKRDLDTLNHIRIRKLHTYKTMSKLCIYVCMITHALII